MDAEHNETNPTITFHRSHEDSEVRVTHMKQIIRSRHEIIRWKNESFVLKIKKNDAKSY